MIVDKYLVIKKFKFVLLHDTTVYLGINTAHNNSILSVS